MIELPLITLVLADTKNYALALNSLKTSLGKIKPARTIFFTDIDYNHGDDRIEVIKIPTIISKDEYSKWIFYELYKYIETPYILIQQWDSHVLDENAWDDKFLNYDVVSPPWLYIDNRNVGCGGWALRSYKVQKILGTDPFIKIYAPEDECLGRLYRHYLEETYDIRFAPEELADKFGFELRTPVSSTFGFHSYFHKPYQKTIMITRKGALGDIVALEPVMRYYHLKGYRVVLNTLPQFFNLFIQHYFKVHHPSELDGRIEYKEIVLDMAYEVKPKQLHLKSYFEACGIPENEMILSNPKLSLDFNPKHYKIFNKLCLIHYDRRSQNGRNIHGVDWWEIVDTLQDKGYTVVQIGLGDREPIDNAIQMNTPNEPFLMWLIGGAELFISCDSGPANIAVAMGIKSIIFFGNVEPSYIYPDLSNIKPIQIANPCTTPKCWHSVVSCTGMECIVDETKPPCIKFETEQVINAINEMLS